MADLFNYTIESMPDGHVRLSFVMPKEIARGFAAHAYALAQQAPDEATKTQLLRASHELLAAAEKS